VHAATNYTRSSKQLLKWALLSQIGLSVASIGIKVGKRQSMGHRLKVEIENHEKHGN
jgi:hypothetical protein